MTEEQLWAIGAGVVALLIAVLVSVVLNRRSQAASESRVAGVESAIEARSGELSTRLQEQNDTVARRLRALESMVNSRLDAEAAERQQDEQRIQASLAELREQILHRLDEQAQQVQQQVRQALDALGAQVAQTQQALRETGARVDTLERDLRLTRTEAALAQAVILGWKARTHLSEQDTGLAQHALTELDAELQRALEFTPESLRPRIDEARRSVGELKEGVDARTFPVAAVEMLTDRIHDLIGIADRQRAGVL